MDVLPKQFERRRGDDLVHECGGDKASDDYDGERVQNLLSRLPGPEGQRDEPDHGRQGGHEDRGQSLQGAANDQLISE